MEEVQSKKSWIKVLAEQSWEAELIVSGVAIFGALSLPGQLEILIDWLLIRLTGDYLLFGSILVLYIFFGIQVLIAGFLVHFALRVSWIGFVGLYSVYPEGIKKIKMYSDDFNEKLKKDFPGLESYIKTLDDTSSLVFAGANSGILSMFAVIVTGALVVGICAIVHQILPNASVYLIFLVCVSFILIPSLMSSLLHLKMIREKEWVKKIHYPIYIQYSKIVLNIAFKPLNYLLLTFYSNIKTQRVIVLFFGIIMLLGIFSGGRLANSNHKYFDNDRYFSDGARVDYVRPQFYEDEKEEEDLVIHALIPSRQVKSPYLEVFIPSMGREKAAKKELCGKYKENEDLSEEENRQERRKFNIECEKEFHQFYVNDSLLTPMDMYFSQRNERAQVGVMAILDLGSQRDGKHTLTIKKKYYDKEEKQLTVNIPFIYTKTLSP